MSSTILLVFLYLVSVGIPPSILSTLDRDFPGWKAKIDFVPCQLNADTVTDYATGIIVPGKPDTLCYFLAFVSNSGSFAVARLDSCKIWQGGCGYFLRIEPKGKSVTNFGFDDEENFPEEKRTSPRDPFPKSVFPTDCITLTLEDKNYCRSFVYHVNRFRSFSSCD